MSGAAYGTCFLIGSARSGTTWLSTALGANPNVHCTEHRLFGRHFDVVHNGQGSSGRVRITLQSYCDSLATCCNLEGLGADPRLGLERTLARSLFDFAHEQTCARVIVDKVTPYVGSSCDVADGIARYFPDSKIIQLMRDPRDVVVSGVMHWLGRWTGEGPTALQRQRNRWILEGEESSNPGRFVSDAEIEDWSEAWLEARSAIGRLPSAMPVRTVRYETMLAGRRDVLDDLFQWLGVGCDDEALDRAVDASSFVSMSGGRKGGEARPGAHVRKGVAGDWKSWLTRRDGELLWSRLGEALVAESYASDDSWIEALPVSLGSTEPARTGAPV